MTSPTETAATLFLDSMNVPYETRHYDYAPEKGHIGEQAAEALGAAPEGVFKTLAVKVDRKVPAFVVLPVKERVDFKAVAAALGGRNAKMMQPDEAHDRTGYVQGGTTPFGSRQTLPVVLDASAEGHEKIWINAGAQGFLVCLAPEEIIRVTGAVLAKVTQPAG
ncbi:Cys-tRNA(Pro) deacylase [Oecophyllibacter saccharovorans]|uniref:Cys-tRNA(Pro) deacylase n=1 Tax=Oecophyllibacter saccharovorans TaxID=2558360 RepID=UPI0011426AEB|nr:Cys-tRNA(Pro) deacylase [Oecophyllibacter saccharovorans]QDH14904.1 Cys-tRNA(Pro) deacylase [Oecophyllibacter saccharovorans]